MVSKELVLPSPAKSFDAQEPLVLLAMCIWAEARGEPYEGKAAVGCVVRNRVHLQPRYGEGYRAVILKPRAFSAFNPSDVNALLLRDPLAHDTAAIWTECYRAAELVYRGSMADITGKATHYFAHDHAPPYWAAEMTPTVIIANHSFYREV